MKTAYRVDIHIHTQASDGVWTPSQLVREVEKEGIDLFAATDHNSVASVAEAGILAEKRELLFLTGVEFDTTFDESIYHVLGYGIDIENEDLKGLTAHNRSLQHARDMKGLGMLERDGFEIDWDAYERYEHDPSRGGWKLMTFCIDKGLCNGRHGFFTQLFNADRPIPHPSYPHPAEAVRVIEAAGGIPVCAHPFGTVGGEYRMNRIEVFAHMKDAGVRGLECYSTYHSREQIDMALAFCRDNGLLITGGSDSHGSFTPNRQIGRPHVTSDDLELGEIAERAGLPAAARACCVTDPGSVRESAKAD